MNTTWEVHMQHCRLVSHNNIPDWNARFVHTAAYSASSSVYSTNFPDIVLWYTLWVYAADLFITRTKHYHYSAC